MPKSVAKGLRGRLLTFTSGERDGYRYEADGLILIRDGVIAAVGAAAEVLPRLPPGAPVDHYPDGLILPGLIDPHIHYPQTQVIASYGAQLLDWLQGYTFVEEQKYARPDHAEAGARFFLDELLRNGTTTAAVYCTVHPESVDAFFAEAERRHMRMIAGKVMMDRGAPEGLLDTPERGYRESRDLLARWHGRGRALYAVTPRFAITSTDAQLEAAGALVHGFPDCHVQTHLCENRREIETVKTLFPWAHTYTEVYERFGLLTSRTLLGHCIHLENSEVGTLSATGSVAVFCPTSNLFIGSGLFDLGRLGGWSPSVRTALATDVGAGTSYSMLRTAAEAYKVLQLQGQNLPAIDAFRMMTRGNAEALGLERRIGSIEPGLEADLVVLDARATPAMAHRMETVAGDLAEELFVLMTLGDDRAVRATYVMGERLYAA
jgi:guanine deaminase